MKLSADDLKEILSYLETAKDISPIADDMVETVFAFSPAIKKLADAFFGYLHQSNVDTFKFYLDNGFSREEAMVLIIDAKTSLQVLMSNKRNNSKGE